MATVKQTREEAMARFMAAKARKLELIKEMETRIKEKYEKRTGQEATYVVAL